MPDNNQAPVTTIADRSETPETHESLSSPEALRNEVAALITECLDDGLKIPAVSQELGKARNQMEFMGELLRQSANPFKGLHMERVTSDPIAMRRAGIPNSVIPDNTYVLTTNAAELLGEDPRAVLEAACVGPEDLDDILAKSVNSRVSGDQGLAVIQMGEAPVYLTVPVENTYRYDRDSQKGVFELNASYSRATVVVRNSVTAKDGSTVSYGETLVANAVKRVQAE